jgi:PAS domain S-box-containing protein
MAASSPPHLSGESDERYRRLFETAQEGIVLTTPSGEIIDCNPTACELTGYEREELIGSQASGLYDAEVREELVQALQEEGQVKGMKVRLRSKEDEELLCLVSAILWTDEAGEPTAIQSFVRDVTEGDRARTVLVESEEKFRGLAENAPIGIALLQGGPAADAQQWVISYANPACAEILGYHPKEIIGRSPKELCLPEDWPSVREWIRRRLDRAGEARFKARGKTKSGEVRHIEVFGGRITHQGRPALVGGLVDVTERHRLQREIMRIQEEERKRLGQDLHDGLASKLTAARMKLENLTNRVERALRQQTSGQSEGSKEAASEADRAGSLIDDLREIESEVGRCADDTRRLSRGLAPPAFSSDEGLLKALRRLADSTNNCSLVVGDEIEEAGDFPTLSSEEKTQLYWVVQEAVTNARRHSGADCIVIRLTKSDGALTLAVEDDGKGFERSEVERESLGLRSMRHRADLIGADFSVDTEPGEGTRVRCRFSR